MQTPRPSSVRGGAGALANPIVGFDVKARTELCGVIVVPAYFFQLRPRAEPRAQRATLGLGVVVFELTDALDLGLLNEKKAPCVFVSAHHVRPLLCKGSPAVESAIRHDEAMIAKAVLEAPFVVPFVDRQEHLKGRHAVELAGPDSRAMKNSLPDGS